MKQKAAQPCSEIVAAVAIVVVLAAYVAAILLANNFSTL